MALWTFSSPTKLYLYSEQLLVYLIYMQDVLREGRQNHAS